MGSWRISVAQDVRLDLHDPDARLLVESLIYRLIPELRALPFDFVLEINGLGDDDPG